MIWFCYTTLSNTDPQWKKDKINSPAVLLEANIESSTVLNNSGIIKRFAVNLINYYILAYNLNYPPR